MDEAYYRYYRENGKRIAEIKKQAVEFAQSHEQCAEIDAYVDRLIVKAGGEPAFKKVPGYKWATCICLNDELVHGIPKGKIAKSGDLMTIDMGMYYHGTTTDTATSFVIGQASPEQEHFLGVGRQALKKVIKAAKVGRRVRDLAEAVQETIEAAGFNVTRNLTGHAVGKTMHEEPMIPNFVSSDPVLRVRLVPGMTLALEVMYMAGNWPLVVQPDKWTMSTADGQMSAVFEEDVLLLPGTTEVLTR